MRKPKGLIPNAGMKRPRPNNNEMPNKRPRMNNAIGDNDNKRSFHNGNNMRYSGSNNKEGGNYKSYDQRNFGYQQNMYNKPPNSNFDQNMSQYPPVHAASTYNNHYQQQQMQFPQFAFTSYPPPALPKN